MFDAEEWSQRLDAPATHDEEALARRLRIADAAFALWVAVVREEISRALAEYRCSCPCCRQDDQEVA